MWRCFAVLVAEYIALFGLSTLALEYLRAEVAPPPPIHVPDDAVTIAEQTTTAQLPFEPVSFAFQVSISLRPPAPYLSFASLIYLRSAAACVRRMCGTR